MTDKDSNLERAEAILASLNGWNQKELIALEQPELDPNYLVSGETRAFVESRKQQLRELGYEAVWDPDATRYVLQPGA